MKGAGCEMDISWLELDIYAAVSTGIPPHFDLM
jgi:hypothetical protein